MQRTQSKGFHRGGKMVQSALQLLLSRVQSSISNTSSVTHFPGRSIRDLEQIALRGLPLTVDDLPAFADAIDNLHGTINDREFLLEKVLVLMARLPGDSVFARIAQQHVISLLYKDLPHPPTGFLSTFHNAPSTIVEEQTVSYAFRSADGSNYNVLFPSLGQAGQPYARSVPSTHIQTLPSLPDPGLVFDSLLCRRSGDFIPHPGGLSSLFFAFADLIIHSIFNTNTFDWTINDASSYLDLSIIYGSNMEQVESMRKKDGTGKIWNDAFADRRLLFMPPSVCALAVLFSRHHNYIAQKILDLNERGSFTSPQPDERTSLLAQDDEIYHRARMVNTAFFMQIILADYVGGILGLVRDGLTWRLDPLASFRDSDHGVSPRGHGNAVSIEFNLLYHWHASICEQDEKCLNELFGELFKDRNPTTVTAKEFRKVVREKIVPTGNVKTWTFGGLQRGSDGLFADQDLARVLQDATERRAGAFRARGCPPVMRVVEILAIEQGRRWGACTLNEFRKYIGLRPYESFQEWNPDPIIHVRLSSQLTRLLNYPQSAAEELYGHIDNLELHVGLQAEETKPPIPGAGLCPGYTISRAILADAVCLTRGDRFLTVDFTRRYISLSIPFTFVNTYLAYNLTSWGYQHCMVNTADGSYGGMLSRLLFHLLPDQYPGGSIYAHFPFMTPDIMRPCIASRSTGLLTYYDFSRPSQVGDDDRQLDILYRKRMSRLTKGVQVAFSEVRKIIADEALPVVSFTKVFETLVEKASISAGCNLKVVDIVRDVINRAPIYWAANFVLGLPITVFDSVLGGHTVAQWFELFADVTRYMYLNDDPVHDWTLYQAALKATNEIMYYLRNRLERHSGGIISLGSASDILVTSLVTSNVQNDRFIADVLASAKHSTIQNIAYSIFAEIVPSALMFSACISSVVDYYADPSREKELGKLIKLSKLTKKDDRTGALMKLIDDALTHREDDGPSPPGLIVGNHKIDIRGQGGLMSQDVFAKLAPQVVAAIFSVENVSFVGAQTEFDGGLPTSRVIQVRDD
ncbi:heme peroxidase [Lanmaoa asiatica]|nr:heme peroxidase [Lanmaoa asiatica]